jgi:cytochrome c biogenesis factor
MGQTISGYASKIDIFSMSPMQMLMLIIMMILIAPPSAGKSDMKRRQKLNRSGDSYFLEAASSALLRSTRDVRLPRLFHSGSM